LGRKGALGVEKGDDPAGPREKEEYGLLGASAVVAGRAGGDDDAELLPAAPAGEGDHVLRGKGSVRGRGGPEVDAASAPDALLQLTLQGAAVGLSPHLHSPGEGS